MNRLICNLFLITSIYSMSACNEPTSEQQKANSFNLYVDASKGDDVTGDGTLGRPYKSITAALEIESFRKNILLSNGKYDVTSGEVFPIVIPTGITLAAQGESDITNNKYVSIEGSGSYFSSVINGDIQTAIVLKDTATLANLVITATDAIAIWDEGDSSAESQIRNCTIRNSRIGISSVNASSLWIEANSIIDNQASGIELFNNVTPILINNLISNNGVGISVLDNSLPSFKLSTSDSGNRILGNKSCDLRHQGNLAIDTIGTIWDDDVFNFTIASNCSNGENIANEGVGATNFQFTPNPDTLIFPDTTRITTNSPQFGELLFVQKPSFSWQIQDDGIVAIVVMKQPPKFDSNGTINPKHIVWIWHTGLPTTTPGSVDFDDGRTLNPPYDKFKNVSEAVALEKGRSYFWGVLQWDSQTSTKIVASSALNYFLTSN